MGNPHTILFGLGIGIFMVAGWLLYESRQYGEMPRVLGVSVCEEYVQQTNADLGEIIDQYYAPLHDMSIGPVTLRASIAQTPVARQQGLSNTPCLPRDVVKLFVFDSSNTWGFWMKDMNYSIDIIWVDESGRVVDWVEAVSPETYPESFRPREPARYVIETIPNFVTTHSVGTSTTVQLPDGV